MVCSSEACMACDDLCGTPGGAVGLANWLYALKWPSTPWKNDAAIGGAVTINTVSISPNPPCCSAMLLMPSWLDPVNLPTQNAAETESTISNASATITLRTASENNVPIP